jgi:hypothetical protein
MSLERRISGIRLGTVGSTAGVQGMAKLHDPHDDPNVQLALKERSPEEVSLACCRKCGQYSHFDGGFHFTCHWCGWSASGGTLDDMLETGEVISLADYADLEIDPGIP